MIKAKHPNIANELQDRIINGEYESKLPGINVLAEEYGVNNRTMIKAIETLENKGCVKRIPSKGTFVTRLKRTRTHILGVVVGTDESGFAAPIHSSLIRGLNQTAHTVGESVIIGKSHHQNADIEIATTKELVEKRQVDGIVIWPADPSHSGSIAVNYLIEHEIPFVVVPEPDLKIYGKCHTVSNSDSSGAADMVTHLIKQGYRDIAFMADSPFVESIFVEHRYAQYRKVMLANGLKPEEPFFIPSCYYYPDKDVEPQVMEKLKNKDAVFCCTDGIAVKLMRECLRLGIRVPGDLAVSGYDNTHFAKALGLSSVEQHFEKIGEKAVKLLLEDIERKKEKPVHLQVESELIIRGSSRRER